LTISLSLSVQAKDEHQGKSVYDENCLKCHKVLMMRSSIHVKVLKSKTINVCKVW